MNKKLRFITTAAMIAAVYAVLTILLSFSSYGLIQFRVAEALTVLPYFTPAAIPGLFVGCILANISSPFGPVDVVCGSFATLIAACLSRIMPSKYLVPLPPVVINALMVGIEIHYSAIATHMNDVAKFAVLPTILMVGAGEAAVCYGLGLPLLLLLKRHKIRMFQ